MKIKGSSHIQHAEYDEQSRTLHVGFNGGNAYAYQNVPPEKWEAFQKSDSKGGYLAAEIKPHHRVWPVKDYKWAE